MAKNTVGVMSSSVSIRRFVCTVPERSSNSSPRQVNTTMRHTSIAPHTILRNVPKGLHT